MWLSDVQLNSDGLWVSSHLCFKDLESICDHQFSNEVLSREIRAQGASTTLFILVLKSKAHNVKVNDKELQCGHLAWIKLSYTSPYY